MLVVLLCMVHLISNIYVSGSLSDFGTLSEVVLDLCYGFCIDFAFWFNIYVSSLDEQGM